MNNAQFPHGEKARKMQWALSQIGAEKSIREMLVLTPRAPIVQSRFVRTTARIQIGRCHTRTCCNASMGLCFFLTHHWSVLERVAVRHLPAVDLHSLQVIQQEVVVENSFTAA